MPKRPKFRVYLAGPIRGCNDDQLRGWREQLKKEYDRDFEFIDPTGQLLRDGQASSYAIVEADRNAIEDADGLLVNMWRESIGTAFGVIHARNVGRPVVVADPNHLNNRVLAFYADAVVDSPRKAASLLRDILRAEGGWLVVKHRGRSEEPFERRKLVRSLRGACRDAGGDDIVVPQLVLPRVIESLQKNDRRLANRLTAADLDKAVTAALHQLDRDDIHRQAVQGVREEWQKLAEEGSGQVPIAGPETPQLGVVPLESSKSHSTLWGKTVRQLSEIPSAHARKAFEDIYSVDGITRIVLRAHGHKGTRATCRAWVGVSKSPRVIEGKIYDVGNRLKGTMQRFQGSESLSISRSLLPSRRELARESPECPWR